ncbi:MAG: hypothetical protein ACSLEM_06790 [Candidatus Malihini olakiniferum]
MGHEILADSMQACKWHLGWDVVNGKTLSFMAPDPVSAWAIQVKPRRWLAHYCAVWGGYEGDSRGYEWLPPAEMTHALIN